MKKLLFITAMLLSVQSYSQSTPEENIQKASDYAKTSENLKLVGYSAMVVGTVTHIIGLHTHSKKLEITGQMTLAIGTTITISSIPFRKKSDKYLFSE